MTPQIKLYTAHHCPFAHRVQIALRELGLTFDTVLVDITTPRTPEYLAINSTGMVPALLYDGRILTESGLICQFLVDQYPESRLVKTSSEEGGALQRYMISCFVEVFSKTHAIFDAVVYSLGSQEEKASIAEQYIEAVAKNVEPFLQDSAPFFGGASEVTLAEVLAGPFVLRVLKYPSHAELVPNCVLTRLQERAPLFWSWAHAIEAKSSVTAIWDEALVVERTLERIKRSKMASKK
ncbi:thioredoxin-like protein [Boeremia exigua]|uniref:thioredoxin-like protein n=1 Tax=Boeremia exigua TaxID=749465 RepID=UPI001E8E33FC|nr:thioredoxin-like protein [Boeremia exigua]KAH6643704.1 thioredoxin-like protein [Boeremia exigua]